MHHRLTIGLFLAAVLSSYTGLAQPTECDAPAVRAFAKKIQGILSRSQKPGKDPEELWSKDPAFRRLAKQPKAALPKVELFLRCSPPPAPAVQLATLTLQCLDLDAYLDYAERVSRAPRSEPMEWALHYAVAPGPRWSTRLAVKHDHPSVNATLKRLIRSPNVTLALQRLIAEILDGSTKKQYESSPTKPLLVCGS